MIKCGRLKTVQKKSSLRSSNVSFKTWLFLRFKNTKDGSETVSGNAPRKWNNNRVHGGDDDDDDGLYLSDHRLNVSPVSFKKTASNGKTIREFISEEYKLSRIGKTKIMIQATSEDRWKSTFDDSRTRPRKLNSDHQTEWQNINQMKPNEIMLKNVKLRKSVDVSKETRRKRSQQGRKVNGYSPRIKALEDMKRTRMRMKTKEMKDVFAIVKTSFDPQRDFRHSMMEMIITKGIRQRDELEELLTCYLTLNSDEYHDLIVKVFQQVWLELNQIHFYQ